MRFIPASAFDAHEYLGAHPVPGGTVFRVFAPRRGGRQRADRRGANTRCSASTTAYTYIYLPGAGPGTAYEYRVWPQNGAPADHCDPYGFGMELRPDHRSIVRDLDAYTFGDSAWQRRGAPGASDPLNIYEMHLGSWRRKPDGGWYTYEELAEPLADYLTESGYNAVEFLPLAEYPADESWGYQTTVSLRPPAATARPPG